MKSDILFIHPGNQRRVYQDLSFEFTAIATPVWTSLLAQHVRLQGYSVAIYDVNVDGWDEQVPAKIIADYDPELIVMMVYGHTPSASTQTMPAARKIALDIKRYNSDLPVALGGIHPSALPERTLREEMIDFVIQGEGAYTIDGLVKMMKGKQDKENIPGLWYRDGQEIRHTLPAPVINDLDSELPGYAWDLLPDFSRYRAHNMHCFQYFQKSQRADFADVRSPYVTLNTSLGCPYHCHYCCINAIFDKPRIRYWSLERVMDWIGHLVSHGVKNIRLDDELFILSPKRVDTFCDMIIERKYDLNLWVYGRVDTISELMLEKFKRAGINWICLGIESASEAVRNDVDKRIKKDISSVVKAIQSRDIYVLGNFMFGLPEDSHDTMKQTLQLAIDLNCEFVNFYTVMAYPGSELYSWAETRGELPKRWECYSQHGYDSQPLSSRYLPARDILSFRDQAFEQYFMRPQYLAMMEQKFGQNIVDHIQRMLGVKIKRRLTEDPKEKG